MVKENLTPVNPLKETIVTRQPIFDRKKEVFAYELQFKSKAKDYSANFMNPKVNDKASAKVVDSVLISGLKKLTNGKKAVISFSHDMLVNLLPMIFPSEMLGVELLDDESSDKIITDSIKQLKKKGYLVVMNNHLFNRGDLSLVKMADIIGVDFRSPGLTKRFSIFNDDPGRPRFMARSVETPADYDVALNSGYQFFQGNFFNSVDLIAVRNIPGYKINLMRILKEINKPAVEFERIEEILKKDVSITYKLLRFINSSSFGFKTQVNSIRHALTLLGEVEVKKWLSLIVLSSVGTDKPQELVQHTLVRAKFCESIAETLNWKNEMPLCFLMGMFSQIDAFLGRPIEEILSDIPLESEVKSALIGKHNRFRDVLELVIAYEQSQWQVFDELAENLELHPNDIASLYIDAVEWGKLL